jgi:hypothetical protein
MPSLLSLPREIRDQIIEYVICFHKEPPQDPVHSAEFRQDATGHGALRPPNLSPWEAYNALGLLKTNLQLKAETQDRFKDLKSSYALDVMVINNELWPTWMCCPLRAPGSIDTISVSLRFFNTLDDPYIVHVAQTCRTILQGRKWTSTSLHPLAELFLYIHNVCLEPNSKGTNRIRSINFDTATAGHFRQLPDLAPPGSLSDSGLKILFGKHRSLWNSFRSIHQYPFAGRGVGKSLELRVLLKIMILLMLQDAWEDECATYANYVGIIGSAFRSVKTVQFTTDGKKLEEVASGVLSS